MINRAIFEEKWKLIRSDSTAQWSLLGDYDLIKVDKAEIKLDKFITMLQVKYGYTRQEARDEFNKFWAAHETISQK